MDVDNIPKKNILKGFNAYFSFYNNSTIIVHIPGRDRGGGAVGKSVRIASGIGS